MHGFKSGITLGLIYLGLSAGWAQADPPAEAVVTVPDAALRAVLEDSLGLSEGASITAVALARLTVLEAPDAGIVALTGLELATGLTRLDLGPGGARWPWENSNAISDLAPLSGLTGLTYLSLSGNAVVEVSALSGLTGLTELNLQGNRISEVSALAGLTGLTDLYLALNPLSEASSLSGLTGLTGLTSLHLEFNGISDLAPLAGLTGLTELYLRSNALTEVSGLAGLTNLTRLSLWRNNISDVAPLAGLTGLTRLDLLDNDLSDVTPLAGLTGLTWLDLADNGISDVTPLAGLTGLTRLDLSGNNISDVTPLAGLTGLTYLDLAHNWITDVSPLAGLTSLRNLFIDRDVDVSPLSDLTGLTRHFMLPLYRYPQLHSLSRLVEAYEDALLAGRVTGTVVPGKCDLYDRPYPGDFRTWDPAQPAPSIYVDIKTDTRSRVDAVARFLEVHGIAAYIWKDDPEGAFWYGLLSSCVPVPLLVPLSEQPGVYEVGIIIPASYGSPSVIEEESWGAIKHRFK